MKSFETSMDQVLRYLPLGVTVQDTEGTLIYANEAAAKIVGCKSAKEFLSTPLKDIFSRFEISDEHGDPFALTQLPGRRALISGNSEDAVLRFRILDNQKELWSYVKAQPIIERGKLKGVVNMFHDLTTQKETEEKLQILSNMGVALASALHYEARLKQLADLVVPQVADWCAIDMLDLEGNIQRVTVTHQDPQKAKLAEELHKQFPPKPSDPQGAYRILESGQAQIYPEITTEMIKHAAKSKAHLKLLLSLDIDSAAVVPLIARNKTLGLITFVKSKPRQAFKKEDLVFLESLARKAAVLVDNARLYSIMQREMEKQKIIQKELEENQKTLKMALDIGHMMVWDWEIHDGQLVKSSKFSNGFHTMSSTVTTFDDFLHTVEETDREKVNKAIIDAITQINRYEIEFQIRTSDGTMRWLFAKGEVLPDPLGQPVRLVGISMDITDRKIEEKRRDHFVGIASHELKSPLASIKAILGLLTRRLSGKNIEKAEEYLHKISNKTDILARLINDLLDVTRIRQGKLEFYYELFIFDELVKEMVDEVRLEDTTHKIVSRLNASKEIMADRTRIAQVIKNLLRNAVKYSPVGSKISVITKYSDKQCVLLIQDAGPGIAKKDRKKIFDLYYRGTNTKEVKVEGLGVGLFITSQIVKQQGGTIWVEGNKGEGATFGVKLPLKPANKGGDQTFFKHV